MRVFVVCLVIFCASAFGQLPALFAQAPTPPPLSYSDSQRELGVVILADVSVSRGVLSFTAPSGGCTDKSSFKVTVKKAPGAADKTPRYALTVERIKADDCKALLAEGVTISFDLEKDLGLKGDFILTISNPMYPKARMNF